MRIAVIGLGLIGGSIALAARERLGAETAGWDLDPSATAAAAQRGAIGVQCRSVAEAVGDADAAFVAAPVGALPDLIAEVLRCAGEECVVTDVGSTKRAIVASQDDRGSSAATRSRAPRPPASPTPEPTCSTAPPGI